MNRFWAWPAELKEGGILGINRRNVSFIAENNPRQHYPRVDNKLITKKICHERGIPVPDTYGVITEHSNLNEFENIVDRRREFVIKPASGAAGRGIIVVADRDASVFITPSGKRIDWSDLRYHLSTIISGLYSLGGQLDSAIIERRIVSHPSLMGVAVDGTPDIRVIVYRGVPTMAMMRLPTSRSGGRANLHQGAAATAIDLVTGKTYGGVLENRAVTHHPDTNQLIAGIEVPEWDKLLDAATQLSSALEIGYVGVDFVIDAALGPVVLEANARPGLAIQLAHREGLLPRLQLIRSLSPNQRNGENRNRILHRLVAVSNNSPSIFPEDVESSF